MSSISRPITPPSISHAVHLSAYVSSIPVDSRESTSLDTPLLQVSQDNGHPSHTIAVLSPPTHPNANLARRQNVPCRRIMYIFTLFPVAFLGTYISSTSFQKYNQFKKAGDCKGIGCPEELAIYEVFAGAVITFIFICAAVCYVRRILL